MGRLEAKGMIVTGAGSGIGAASAITFAQEGGKVLVTDINGEGAAATVETIKSAGGTAEMMVVDATDSAQVQEMIGRAESLWGGLDVLHNNAANIKLGRVGDVSEEDFQWTIQQSILPFFLGTKYAIPAFNRRGGGVIVNTASVAGLIADKGLVTHVTCKHAVLGLTKSTALDYAKENIRANAFCPAATLSPSMRAMLDAAPEHAAAVELATPMGRASEPEEQAKVALFLASDDSSYMTGAAIAVDGGLVSFGGIQIDWGQFAGQV